jgi:hypothetical protein
MYNATSNSWTSFPNGLGRALHSLSGASLPSGLVFFAGGESEGDELTVARCVDLLVAVFCCSNVGASGACLADWSLLLVRACLVGSEVTRLHQAGVHQLKLQFTMQVLSLGLVHFVLQALFRLLPGLDAVRVLAEPMLVLL